MTPDPKGDQQQPGEGEEEGSSSGPHGHVEPSTGDATIGSSPFPIPDRPLLAAAVERAQVLGEMFPEAVDFPMLQSYRLERRLGEGGMGEVFEARHVETDDRVALKVLSLATATRLYRFKREFRALADISHPNLIRLYELVVPQTGPTFFTMELLEGKHFVDWVRDQTPVGRLPNLGRLEVALRQLVTGVHHLHTQGCVHRDLKPSNVMVTSAGRVVILDFGLVSEISELGKGITHDRQILGTPSYMSPEQAQGLQSGPAADYYAIGVILYECLTGRLPHEGPAFRQLLAKQDTTVDPGMDVAGLPGWLRKLCTLLLSRAPEARPAGRDLLTQLRVDEGRWSEPTRFFLGRDSELRALHSAFAEMQSSEKCTIVHLLGRSGNGKSALVRRLCDELEETKAVVLSGRCRETEMIPYKGVDAIVDALSVYLRRLPAVERAALCPPDLGTIIRLFPVLDEIWSANPTQVLGLGDVRRLGGLTLRKLLGMVAQREALFVCIDDFQWADQDSIDLLTAVVRPPDAPPMLILLSYRSEAGGSGALESLRRNDILTDPEGVMIELGALSGQNSRKLAALLLRDGGVEASASRADVIAMRSNGSPLFIEQMAMGGDEVGVEEPDLEQVVGRRILELAPDERQVLNVVAVSGGPIPIELARDLCEAKERTVDSLCEYGLLVRTANAHPDGGMRIEAFHDRIREAALAQLGSLERRTLHHEIGRWLHRRSESSMSNDDVYAMVDHLLAGSPDFESLTRNERIELAKLAERAGRQALDSGAWTTSRRYYGIGLELLEPWLEDARAGRDPYQLCFDVAFGLSRAEIMLDDEEGDRTILELLSWPPKVPDHCRIARWYCQSLFLKGAFEECTGFALSFLSEFGIRVPTEPSLLRAILMFLRGWRAILSRGLDDIRSSPEVADDVTSSQLDVLAIASGPAAASQPLLHVAMMGVYGRLIAQNGLHHHSALGLSGLAISAVATRRYEKARELVAIVEASMPSPESASSAHFMARISLHTANSSLYPVDRLAGSCYGTYMRAAEVAPRPVVEFLGIASVYVFHLASVPLEQVSSLLSHMRERSTFAFADDFIEENERQIGWLTGEIPITDEALDIGSNLTPIIHDWLLLMRALVHVLLGRDDGAMRILRPLTSAKVMTRGPFWFSPVHSMLQIVVGSGCFSSGDSCRQRLPSRALRKHRRNITRWAEGCPDNFGPMLQLVEGELAVLRGDHDVASSSYERARGGARGVGIKWLEGLASERLLRLAHRRGHTAHVAGAYEMAVSAHVEWGATAVTDRLEEEWAEEFRSLRIGHPSPRGKGRIE